MARFSGMIVMMMVGAFVALAGVGEWKTYTSKREVRGITIDRHGVIWAATGGGMFSFRSSDSTFNQFTTSEGLKTIDLTAIAADSSGSIWVGSQNGFVHKYDPAANTWQYVSDINLRSDPFKRINALQVIGDTLFILSDIGVSVFSISKMEFGDTYARFGASPNQIIGNVTSLQLFSGSIWVGTRNGIASTPVISPNPSVPESWQTYTTGQGLPSNYINDVAIDYDSLFAATQSGLAVFDGTSWYVEEGTSGLSVLNLTSGAFVGNPPTHVFFITPAALWQYSTGSPPELFSNGFLSNLTSLGDMKYSNLGITEKLIVGTTGNGCETIAFYSDSTVTKSSILPPGPPSNKFVGIAVDQRGVVWSGTGVATGEGFMSFDGTTWKSYNVTGDSRLGTNNYWKVSIGRDNTKWVGNWGAGVALLDDRGTLRKVLNTTNGLSPSIDPTFVVVGGVATDQNGVAWLTDRTGRNDTALVTFSQDSSIHYALGYTPRSPLTIFSDIVIDQNETKWLTNFSRFENVLPVALFYYNERFALPGTVNGWGRLTTDQGLTSNKIYSLAVGKEGEVWVGSDQGISIIFNPGSPRQVHPYHPLRDQIIQAIVVDPLNNKWLATRQGVFVLSSDGTSILNRYTVENTDGKLLDNDVASIALDEHTGMMYFGTEKGLSSLGTTAVAPNRSFNELTFAPNPFYLPSNVDLTVDGLVQNSLIKILTIDGGIIRELRSPGGRIGFWDGTDSRGNIVGTGIYLIIAYAEDGSQVATGKVAVVRR